MDNAILRFYEAFARQEGAAMAACYTSDVVFRDPVFPHLEGREAGDMWRMLCGRAKDLRIEFRDIRVDGEKGRAHWEAWYTFTKTGRLVHNVVDAEFTLRGGRIAV